jgi:hypothetical protein
MNRCTQLLHLNVHKIILNQKIQKLEFKKNGETRLLHRTLQFTYQIF